MALGCYAAIIYFSRNRVTFYRYCDRYDQVLLRANGVTTKPPLHSQAQRYPTGVGIHRSGELIGKYRA